MAADEPAVLVEKREGGVGLLTLNRPKTLNSWNGALQEGLFDGLDAFAADPDVRVIVVTGKGRAFCAGADMGGLQAQSTAVHKSKGGEGKKAAEPPKNPPPVRLINHATTIPKPVIAAINGPAAGLGFAFALSCDFRFCAADAKLTSAFSKRGLIAEHGTSWALAHIVGMGKAMQLLMSSDVILGTEAERIGLVQRCFPGPELLDGVVSYARQLAATVPASSLAVIKQQVLKHPLMDRDAAMHESNRLMAVSTRNNPDYKEGVESFVQKRPPKFGPLDTSAPVLQEAKRLFPAYSRL